MTVAPDDFVSEMDALWSTKLGNHSSASFRSLWHQMATTYLEAIKANMVHNPLQIGRPKWLVMAPEMGAGKTVGACLYLAMMARNARMFPPPISIGGLLVSRTIKQCEEAVASINDYAGFQAAISRHSENSVSVDEAGQYPVLVITHAALTRPDITARDDLLNRYLKWDGGRRCLTIFDEALSDAVEFHQITERSLHKLLGQMPADVREKNQVAWEIINELLGHIQAITNERSDAYVMWDKLPNGMPTGFDKLLPLFNYLLSDLKDAKRHERGSGWNDAEQRRAELKEVGETLQSVILLFRHWAMFAKQGSEPGFLTANSKLPELVSPVLLNATANQDVLLDHIGATIVPMPPVRNYQNLTIRILRSNGIGKGTMAERGKARLQRLCEFIRETSEAGDFWLVVTHKVNEPLAHKCLPPDLGLTAHWGALDGLNDFKDCNKAVLFGLSYRDPTWSSALYFALRGVPGSDWFKTPEAKAIKHKLEAKLMAAQILQAIGRPRSRRVIDEAGNCLPTTIYLTLPESSLGRTVEKYIRQTLQGVVMEPWDFELDSEVSSSGKPNLTSAVVTYMRNSLPGKFTVNEIADSLALDASEKANIKDALKKGRKLVHELEAIGVTYVVEGERRGAKSYLVKSQSSYGGITLRAS